jgi:hypothetical protein
MIQRPSAGEDFDSPDIFLMVTENPHHSFGEKPEAVLH